MSEKPISPLRQRMIGDMTARRFKEKVQKDCVRHGAAERLPSHPPRVVELHGASA